MAPNKTTTRKDVESEWRINNFHQFVFAIGKLGLVFLLIRDDKSTDESDIEIKTRTKSDFKEQDSHVKG